MPPSSHAGRLGPRMPARKRYVAVNRRKPAALGASAQVRAHASPTPLLPNQGDPWKEFRPATCTIDAKMEGTGRRAGRSSATKDMASSIGLPPVLGCAPHIVFVMLTT